MLPRDVQTHGCRHTHARVGARAHAHTLRPHMSPTHRARAQVIGRKRAANYGDALRRAVYRCFEAYERVKAQRRAWDRWVGCCSLVVFSSKRV